MSTDFFDNERYWLEKQPEMQPWQPGCARLIEKLERHIDILLNGKKVLYRSDFLLRIWICISYHWKNAACVNETLMTVEKSVSVEEVLEALAQKVSLNPNRKTLGGNPLPDMVYAVHYVKKEEEDAVLKMNGEYRRYCMGVVRNRSDMINSFDEWWNTFMIKLGGFEHEDREKHASIYRYFGWDHLKSWLATAVTRHACGFLRKENRYTYPGDDVLTDIAIDHETPEELAILIENGNATDHEYLLKVIPRALEELPEKERLAIKYFYYDGLKQAEIKKVLKLKVHKGNVSRYFERLRKKLGDIILKLVHEEKNQPKQNNV